MSDRPRTALTATVLGSPDPRRLARFYGELLGWPIRTDEGGWVTLRPEGGGAGLSFQLEEPYVAPVWPAGPDDQHMQLHLDIEVDDLGTASAYALEHGASLAEFQPQDDVLVLLDPDGHPFCLFTE